MLGDTYTDEEDAVLSPLMVEEVPPHIQAQLAVQDVGLCGEFVTGGSMCMKVAGHEPPHGAGALETAVADPLAATRVTPEELEYINKLVVDLGEANALSLRVEELKAEQLGIETEIAARQAKFNGYLGHLMARYGVGAEGSINSEHGEINRA